MSLQYLPTKYSVIGLMIFIEISCPVGAAELKPATIDIAVIASLKFSLAMKYPEHFGFKRSPSFIAEHVIKNPIAAQVPVKLTDTRYLHSLQATVVSQISTLTERRES
jgi:hypothetical protein